MSYKLKRYLSIFDLKNKRQQPNNIPETRHIDSDSLTVDRYGVWPTEKFETQKPPIWFNAWLLKKIYDHKKITTRSYKHCESFTVLYKGRIIYDWYAPGFSSEQSYQLFSMTKSVVAILLGIAIDQGYISSVKQKVIEFFPEVENDIPLDDVKRALTLEHLLSMTSGLRDDSEWRKAEDTALAGFMRAHAWKPGEKFKYISVNYHIIAGIITRVTGKKLYDYANEYLFTPLGIKTVGWHRLPDGSYRGNGGITMSTEDMMRLGYLWLNNGIWENKQIVSADYIIKATSRSSAPYAFGMPFWNNSWFPFFLFGSYETRGHNGQFISVYPHMDMVIVRTGWPTKRAYPNDRSKSLSGTSFVFDGIFDRSKKNEIVSMIKSADGSIKKRVTKNTSFVITDKTEGINETLAYKLGVPIIDVERVIEMLS